MGLNYTAMQDPSQSVEQGTFQSMHLLRCTWRKVMGSWTSRATTSGSYRFSAARYWLYICKL